MDTDQSVELPRSRCPNGIQSARRFNVGLLPKERELLEKLAAEEGRSTSAMARMLIIRQLKALSPSVPKE